MFENKSQKKLRPKFHPIKMKEGLSFSDYFSDDVPYEVKPVPSLIPMEEQDFPIQAKSLFGGLWESGVNLQHYDCYWLDKEGNFYPASNHIVWAKLFLAKNNIRVPDHDNDPWPYYFAMYRLQYVRVWFSDAYKLLHFQSGYKGNSPSPLTYKQKQSLKDTAIELGYKLYDDVMEIPVDLDEGLLLKDILKNKEQDFKSYLLKLGRKSLFIENMMPNDIDMFKTHLVELFSYLKEELNLKSIPKVKLITDEKNANKVLGKTAYYDSENNLVVLFITNRHQKDILRSFAHEIIHHWQNENQKLHANDSNTEVTEKKGLKDPQYAQNDPWLRQMEKQAYLLGNILFRDWSDKKVAKDRKRG